MAARIKRITALLTLADQRLKTCAPGALDPATVWVSWVEPTLRKGKKVPTPNKPEPMMASADAAPLGDSTWAVHSGVFGTEILLLGSGRRYDELPVTEFACP